MRLIEPLTLSFGARAAAMVAAGVALPFGDGGAFAVARLFDDRRLVGVVRAGDLAADWVDVAARLIGGREWAGMAALPAVMGILNVTPDSFSDGGIDDSVAASVARGLAMVEAGAAIIDIGGESTRPGAAEMPVQQELDRLLPVIEGLRGCGAKISVDTRHAKVMRSVLMAGADIINDVAALAHELDAAETVAELNAPVVLMHMRGDPSSMERLGHYDDVAVDVTEELALRIDMAERAGVARHNIMVDPGVGFAKNAALSMELLNRMAILANLGCPILLGASRKRFVGQYTEAARPEARLGGSVAAALAGVARGARVVRVHDVAETVQALRLWEAL